MLGQILFDLLLGLAVLAPLFSDWVLSVRVARNKQSAHYFHSLTTLREKHRPPQRVEESAVAVEPPLRDSCGANATNHGCLHLFDGMLRVPG